MTSEGLHEARKGLRRKTRDRPVVVDKHAGTVVHGQDLRVDYAGCDGIHYQLFVCEGMVLRLDTPGAVCVVTDQPPD